MVLAATPATILWYGLSRTREGMKGEMGQLKAAIAEQKEHMHRQDRQQQGRGGLTVKSDISTSPVVVVAGVVKGGTPEERIAHLESRLAVLEGHLRGRDWNDGSESSNSSVGSSAMGEELLSGVKRRMLGQFEEGVLEALTKIRRGGSAAAASSTAAASVAAAAAEEKGNGKKTVGMEQSAQ